MINAEFIEIVEAQNRRCLKLLDKKQKEQYGITDDEDRLIQFKKLAVLKNRTRLQSVGDLMSKHTTMIYDLIETDALESKIWQEVINDHMNYLHLLKAQLVEDGILKS